MNLKRNCKFFFLIFLYSLECQIIFSQEKINEKISFQEVFNEANKCYEKGDFNQAISIYISLINTGFRNANVYYNLGNAYYKMNKIGKAILYYERAYRLNPRDDDIKHNLKFLRTNIEEAEPGFFYDIITFLKLDEITLFCSFFYLVLCLFLIIFIFTKKSIFTNLIFYTSFILLIGVLWWYSLYSVTEKRKDAIVIISTAQARTGPGNEYSTGFTMPEGKKVIILGEKGDWYSIGVKQDKPEKVFLKGWIEKNSVEII